MSERVFCHVENVWLSASDRALDPQQGWMHLVGGFRHSVIGLGSSPPWTGTADVRVEDSDVGRGTPNWGGTAEAPADVEGRDVGDAEDRS
jgi:hypothetical protein